MLMYLASAILGFPISSCRMVYRTRFGAGRAPMDDATPSVPSPSSRAYSGRPTLTSEAVSGISSVFRGVASCIPAALPSSFSSTSSFSIWAASISTRLTNSGIRRLLSFFSISLRVSSISSFRSAMVFARYSLRFALPMGESTGAASGLQASAYSASSVSDTSTKQSSRLRASPRSTAGWNHSRKESSKMSLKGIFDRLSSSTSSGPTRDVRSGSRTSTSK
mmetsp:Transcript_52585/g.132256  ORF Transcript_52585/g.132256 Transcript_52585/m.132256 type:complete len:221 (-) Transcript_52585:103-765(-)